jgi:hypothetical protein
VLDIFKVLIKVKNEVKKRENFWNRWRNGQNLLAEYPRLEPKLPDPSFSTLG